MVIRIAELLSGMRTAAGFGTAIERIEAERVRLAASIDELTARRAAALIDATDSEVDKIEAELQAAYRALDRADAICTELRARESAADQAEGRQAEQAAIDKAEAAARDAVKLMTGPYAQKAKELVQVLEQISALESQVEAFNQRAASGGFTYLPDTGLMATPMQRLAASQQVAPPPPLSERVRLPAPGSWGRYMGDGEGFWPKPSASNRAGS